MLLKFQIALCANAVIYGCVLRNYQNRNPEIPFKFTVEISLPRCLKLFIHVACELLVRRANWKRHMCNNRNMIRKILRDNEYYINNVITALQKDLFRMCTVRKIAKHISKFIPQEE